MSTSANKTNRTMSSGEEKQILRYGLILSVSSFIFMTVLSMLVHFDTIRLYPSSMNVDLVKGYAGRVEFALRYQTLLVTWLLLNVFATIYQRITNLAVNPLDERKEHIVQGTKNTLTNSYEQIVLSVFAQLIYISFASPECILKVIPLVNIIQFVGRITFFAGYPMKRSFGFMCTLIPNSLLVAYNLFKFLSFLGLY